MNRTPQNQSPSSACSQAAHNALPAELQRNTDGCPSWSDCDDSALMSAIVQQHQGALAALFDRYAPQVLNLCRRVTGREDIAEDAMLEAFWELWERPNRYQPNRGSPLTYLLTLARSRSIDNLRSDNTFRLRPRKAIASDPSLPMARTLDESTSLDFRADACNESTIDDAMQALGDKCRDAVQLCVINGLTAAQAARSLNVPLGTMKSRIRKGIIQMRSLLRTH